MRPRNNNFSQHILSVSATMLGFSFIVFTSVNDGDFLYPHLIDRFSAAAIVLFTISTLLSFLSLREKINHRAFEIIADYVFVAGILVICGSSLFMISHMKK